MSREAFADVLLAIQERLAWKSNVLAQAMGVTPRTLVRWAHHRVMPAPARRVAVVAGLRELPPDLVARLAASLEVDPRVGGVVSPQPSTPVPEAARATLDAAIYTAADQMNVRAGDLRSALGPLLSAIGDLGIDARTARALVERKGR